MKKYTLNIISLSLLIAAFFGLNQQQQDKENLQQEVDRLENTLASLRQENEVLLQKVDELTQQHTLLEKPPLANSFLAEETNVDEQVVDEEKRLLMIRIATLEKQLAAFKKK